MTQKLQHLNVLYFIYTGKHHEIFYMNMNYHADFKKIKGLVFRI